MQPEDVTNLITAVSNEIAPIYTAVTGTIVVTPGTSPEVTQQQVLAASANTSPVLTYVAGQPGVWIVVGLVLIAVFVFMDRK